MQSREREIEMFMLRLRRSRCSLDTLFPENMPPSKKLKTSDSGKDNKAHSTPADADSVEDFGADWRAHCKTISEVYRYALNKNILTDVTFKVGVELVPFQAHRLILALRSPVFEAMFYGPLAEKEDTITIPDVDSKGFHYFLRFMYSDDISFKSDVIALKTYFIADKYCVSYLKDICEKYLCSCQLLTSNIWVYLEGSLFLNSQSIQDRCFAFLQRNAVQSLHHKSFLDVSDKTIETVLCMDSLNIAEMDLVLNVVRWAEHKSDEDEENSLQSILTPLLKFIRFGALTAAQFITFLEMQKLKDLIRVQDALAILKHINKPSTCPLPDWCCTKSCRFNVEKKKENHSGLKYFRKRTFKDSSPVLRKREKDVHTSEISDDDDTSSSDAVLKFSSTSSSSSSTSSSSSSSSWSDSSSTTTSPEFERD